MHLFVVCIASSSYCALQCEGDIRDVIINRNKSQKKKSLHQHNNLPIWFSHFTSNWSSQRLLNRHVSRLKLHTLKQCRVSVPTAWKIPWVVSPRQTQLTVQAAKARYTAKATSTTFTTLSMHLKRKIYESLLKKNSLFSPRLLVESGKTCINVAVCHRSYCSPRVKAAPCAIFKHLRASLLCNSYI